MVSPSESLRIINEKGLASEWARFIDDYYTGGIANKNILETICSALNVNGIMQGQIINVYQRDGDGVQKGITRVTITYSIISRNKANTVWEVSADGIRGTIDSLQPAPPIVEAVDLAIEKIIDNIPHLFGRIGISRSKPKKGRKKLNSDYYK